MREFAVDAITPDGVDAVLGYLNFAAGKFDANFFSNLNGLFRLVGDAEGGSPAPAWSRAVEHLTRRLEELSTSAPAFRDVTQAKAILEAAAGAPEAYLQLHQDFCFATSPANTFNSFFFGRFLQACLQRWSDEPTSPLDLRRVLDRFDDYVGYRPIPTLENRKFEPYRRERFRPLPIYLRQVGPAVGPWAEVVSAALEILANASPEVRRLAFFDLEAMEELAIDFRGYDFDHPANKRPNYQFGMWDPQTIGLDGRFHRFVVQHVTLDALMSRTTEGSLPREQLIFEAGAVLAGTILMASGISGDSPDAFDSTVSIATLLPRITSCRDKFYEELLERMTGEHGERLRAEAKERRQPFGAARQHLNAQLANRRARQIECVHLARIYARIGQLDAARAKADQSQSASCRVLSQIDGLLTECRMLLSRGDLAKAAEIPEQVRTTMISGIESGALVDPWCILGFSANFSLFPSPLNATHDHRVDDLIDRVEQLLSVYSRLWTEAAARSEGALTEKIGAQFRALTDWWRQFAAHEVSSVEAADPLNLFQAAEHVGQAIRVWRQGGAAAGDIAFWAPHAEMFDTPKAYALVVEALLERGDLIASMALLVHWLSSAERVPLEQGDSSFHALAERWLFEIGGRISELEKQNASPEEQFDAWKLLKRFIDSIEANADEYWNPPQFEIASASKKPTRRRRPQEEEVDDDENVDVVSAAYENMLYADSTDDGVEGNIADDAPNTDLELSDESRRISDRLAFLSTMARLWKYAGLRLHKRLRGGVPPWGWSEAEIKTMMAHWADQAVHNRRGLARLLDQVCEYKLPKPRGDQTSLVEYDQRRLMKESLLERVIATMVETADAERLIHCASAGSEAIAESTDEEDPHAPEAAAVTVFSLLMAGDKQGVVDALPRLLDSLSAKPLLYVPLSRGGDPKAIVAARIRQHTIHDLLIWLPKLGLLTETCRLVEMAREMERNHPVGAGAITEYDELFRAGYRALVEAIVDSNQHWKLSEVDEGESLAQALVSTLEQLTEALLTSWLAHSRTLRLSVLEKVTEKKPWQKLVSFIERYGSELFTQPFLNLGNLRAILHQGVDQWLAQLQEDPSAVEDAPQLLLADLEEESNRKMIVEQLSLVLEAVIENYDEYRDYNSSTTNSDRGEMLYMLLDFLRLRAEYERISWNLRPVTLSHEILVRRGQDEAALMWRRSLSERISDEADRFLTRFAELQKRYSMRMQSIADRLSERFVRPLAIDSLRALVGPAIREARGEGHKGAFARLQSEVEEIGRGHPGAGLSAPPWILAIEDELERCTRPAYEDAATAQFLELAPQVLLSYEETQRQLDEWATRS